MVRQFGIPALDLFQHGVERAGEDPEFIGRRDGYAVLEPMGPGDSLSNPGDGQNGSGDARLQGHGQNCRDQLTEQDDQGGAAEILAHDCEDGWNCGRNHQRSDLLAIGVHAAGQHQGLWFAPDSDRRRGRAVRLGPAMKSREAFAADVVDDGIAKQTVGSQGTQDFARGFAVAQGDGGLRLVGHDVGNGGDVGRGGLVEAVQIEPGEAGRGNHGRHHAASGNEAGQLPAE